jgi:hypothetical protein
MSKELNQWVTALSVDLRIDGWVRPSDSLKLNITVSNTSTFCSVLGIIRENICRHSVSPCDKALFHLGGNKATVARMGVMDSKRSLAGSLRVCV